MNPKNIAILAIQTCLCASAAVPTVSNVTTTQDASRRVTVNYTLSNEPGVVTLTVQTNCGENVWIDLDDVHLTHVAGDVNKLVSVGDHSLTWLPHKSWPDQLITGGKIRIGVKAWATNAPPDYMVVSLASAKSVSFYASAAAIPNGGVTNDLYKTEYLVLRKIPAANVTWRMGSPMTEFGRIEESEAPHEVTLAEDYYIGVYPVTQRQYELVMGERPSFFKLNADYAMRPLENVSYDDIRGTKEAGYDWPETMHAVFPSGFMGTVRSLTGVDGFDLPTDAQWEFACRAGCGAALYNGTELEDLGTSANLGVLARYANNGGLTDVSETSPAVNGTAKVGTYERNAWGLYDMLGNVWEWCLDWYPGASQGYDVEKGPDSGTLRITRGGSWYSTPATCRCACHNGDYSYHRDWGTGFRLVCPAEAR